MSERRAMRAQCPVCGGAGQVAVDRAGLASIARGAGTERERTEPGRLVTIVVGETCGVCAGSGWRDGAGPPT